MVTQVKGLKQKRGRYNFREKNMLSAIPRLQYKLTLQGGELKLCLVKIIFVKKITVVIPVFEVNRVTLKFIGKKKDTTN